jgi:hypothetical protein
MSSSLVLSPFIHPFNIPRDEEFSKFIANYAASEDTIRSLWVRIMEEQQRLLV